MRKLMRRLLGLDVWLDDITHRLEAVQLELFSEHQANIDRLVRRAEMAAARAAKRLTPPPGNSDSPENVEEDLFNDDGPFRPGMTEGELHARTFGF